MKKRILSIILSIMMIIGLLPTTALAAEEAEAKWGTSADSLTENGTLLDAVAAAATDSSITYIQLQSGVTLGDTLDITGGSFTLDLNGQTVSGTASHLFDITGGTVTIDDTSENGKISGASGSTVVYISGGTLNLVGGRLESISDDRNAIALYISGSSTVNISGGEVYAENTNTNSPYPEAVSINSANSSLTVSGGSIAAKAPNAESSHAFGIRAYWARTLNIAGGSISATVDGKASNSWSTGIYVGYDNAIGNFMFSDGSISASGGQRTGGIAFYGEQALTISGGLITLSNAGNYAGAVYAYQEGATVTVVDNAAFSAPGNVADFNSLNNSAKCLKIRLQYTDGVSAPAVPYKVATNSALGVDFTEGWNALNIADENIGDYFTAVSNRKVVKNTSTNELQLVEAYTITFSTGGYGTAPDSQRLLSGEKVTKPEDPVREYYKLNHWCKEFRCSNGTTCENAWDFDNDTVTASDTLYAVWESTHWEVTLRPQGGECDTDYAYADKVTGKLASLPEATRVGYIFNGWFDATEGGNEITTETEFTGDARVYAQWTAYAITQQPTDDNEYEVIANPSAGVTYTWHEITETAVTTENADVYEDEGYSSSYTDGWWSCHSTEGMGTPGYFSIDLNAGDTVEVELSRNCEGTVRIQYFNEETYDRYQAYENTNGSNKASLVAPAAAKYDLYVSVYDNDEQPTTKAKVINAGEAIIGQTTNKLTDGTDGTKYAAKITYPDGAVLTSEAVEYIVSSYTVTFNANEGSGSMETQVVTQKAYTLPECTFTAPEDKIFYGWATSADGEVIKSKTYTLTEDTTFYPVWGEITEVKYTTDDGETWNFDSLFDAIWAYGDDVEIKLLKDINLTSAEWPYSPVFANTNANVTIDGQGHTITRGNGVGIFATIGEADSTVTLKNITIDGGAVWSSENPATRTNSGYSTNGHYYLFDVDDGTLVLDDGAVIQNAHLTNSNSYGGAIAVSQTGKLIMNDGAEIKNCTAGSGGGVCIVSSTASFTMNGGKITDCYATLGGGAVLAQGIFTMNDGELLNNASGNNGGAVTVSTDGVFTLVDGAVKNNSSDAGGGAITILAANSILNLKGGEISGNTITGNLGGGILVNNGTFNLLGNPVIKDNLSGTKASNVYLGSSKVINIADVLSNTTKIGITMKNASVFTSGWNDHMSTAEISDYFVSEDDNYIVAKDEDSGELMLAAKPEYTVTFNANGGIINSGEITSYIAGKETALPTVVSKEGHTFAGWYENKNFTGSAITAIASTDTGDKEYFAKWTVNSYPVTFNAGEGAFADGSKEIILNVEFGTIPVAPEIPVLAGYVFAGWDPALALVTVEGAIYTATYTPDDVSYTVEIFTMDTTGAYGEPERETETAKTDSTVSVTPEAKEGFAIDADASILEKIVEADGSTTLKVYYIRNQYDLTIVVDGIEDTKTYYYGETVETPTIPTKTGYTFDGWDKDIPTTMPARDVDLTAQWTANTNTPYVVKHWVQTLDAAKAQNSEANETNYTLYETENLTGTTDASVNKTKEIAGFKFPEGVVKTFTISADGETVHNYYYVRNKYTITINSDAGIETSSGADQYYYDDTVSISATLKSGYKWTEWIASENGYGSENIAYSFNMPATALVLTPKTTSKDEVSINTDVQSGYVYDKTPKAFEIKGTSLTDDSFTISYKQGETPVANPTNAGTYDVIITRPEDDTYKAYSKTITGGLVIKKKLVDSPIIPIKLYNGFLQTADVEDTDLYEVMKNEGGVEVGDYDVVLKLKDSDNYMWSIVGLDETITLDFNIVPVTHNSWTTDPTISGWTYGDEANAPSYAAKIGHVVVEYKKASEEDSAYTTVIPTNAGEYNVRFTVAETSNHGGLSKVIELNIAKATPLYTPPTNLTATYGQTLADVQGLTNGFTFMAEDTTSVGNAGNNTFKLKFTPADTDNYNAVKNIDATVAVAQKEIGIEWGNTEFTYNKTEQKPTATATDLVAGDSCAITVTGGQINAGNGYVATADSLSNANYKLPASSTTTFSIAQKSVTITGVTIEATRVYNRDTDVTITNYGTVSNVIDGDNVTVNTASATATYNDKNVGNGKSVTFTGFAITGADAANYVLTGQPESQSANITPKSVTITGVTAAVTKIYDANTTATIENNGSVDGVISGDTVDVNSSSATAVYADANVGTDKEVTFAGFAITGTDAANYVLLGQPVSTTANITTKDITGAEIILGETLTYNGNDQTQTIASATVDGLAITYDVSGNVNTDAGYYTLTITGNGNFEGTAQKAYTIAKADATLGTAPSAVTPLTYNAAEQTLINAGEYVVGGTLMYKLGEGEYSAELPKATNAGTYTVYYKVFADNNHNDVTEQSFAVTIAEKVVSPVVVLATPTPNQTPVTSIETDEYTATITWSPAVTDKFAYSTDYTATVTITPKANYTLTGIAENEYTIEGATVTNSADSGVVTAVFPKTSSRPSGGGGVTRYTIKFDTDNGSNVASKTVARNGKVDEPTAPTKDGYTFDGWYTDRELTKPYDFETKVTKGFTLYAKWTEDKTDDTDDKTDTPDTPVWENPFTDVESDDWFYGDVEYAVENGLFNGTTTSTFAPNGIITRAMMVTVLYRAEGEPEVTGEATFEDIDENAYYAKAVIWGQQNGIIKGYSETMFAPDQNITREQIAAIMHRYAQYKGYDVSVGENTNILSYDDFDNISEYAIASMQYAAGSGLMKGKTTSTLNPLDNATRAEIAAILHRFIEANK